LKDRLYTFAADARERRSGQTALAEILGDLLRLLAPILPFTCDEAWQHLPEHLKTSESVHLEQFTPPKPEYVLERQVRTNWDELLRLRGIVSRVLEEARRDGLIGSSLEAALVLTPGTEETARLLTAYEDQLPWVFIVSKCTVTGMSEAAAHSEEGVLVSVERAPGKKCVRCWNYRESVGTVPGAPEICGRCSAQLGESAG